MSALGQDPPLCPQCGTRMVRYVAGLPGDWDELRRAQAAGEFVWSGGCVVRPDAPKWACAPCHRVELEKRLAELNRFDCRPGLGDPGVRFVPVNETPEEKENRREETKRRLREMPKRRKKDEPKNLPGPRFQGDPAGGSEGR